MFAPCLTRVVVLKPFEIPNPFAIRIPEYGIAKANPNLWILGQSPLYIHIFPPPVPAFAQEEAAS